MTKSIDKYYVSTAILRIREMPKYQILGKNVANEMSIGKRINTENWFRRKKYRNHFAQWKAGDE
jgi:hypothetical protein